MLTNVRSPRLHNNEICGHGNNLNGANNLTLRLDLMTT